MKKSNLLTMVFLLITIFNSCKKTEEPKASFVCSIMEGPAPLTVTFTDSSFYAESYKWDFDDGTVSSEKSPTHTFTKEGTYKVSLEVENDNGNDLIFANIIVTKSIINSTTDTDGDGIIDSDDEYPTDPLNGGTSSADREWTILGYFDGNNNLDNAQSGTSFIIEDLQEMELAGSSGEVSTIVMLGSKKTGGNVGYYEITKNENQLPDEIRSPLKVDLGTKDMSDPESLKDFIRWGVENYPAKRYALILNSHGGAWKGICPDEVNGSGDIMSIPALRSAIEEAPFFDIMVFHSCLMGSVEVAYEIKDKAGFMVASEANMPAQSILGADIWLAELIGTPKMESYDLAKKIAQCVYDKGVIAQWKETHMAVTDLSQLAALGSKISDLGTKILNNIDNNWNEVWDAWAQTHYISNDFPSLTDLREFIKQLLNEEKVSKIPLISIAANDVLTTINKAVPFTKSNSTEKKYGGLSIHFPGNEGQFEQNSYSQLNFQKTNWAAFLEKFINSYTAQEAHISGTVTWSGHSLSNIWQILICQYDENNDFVIKSKIDIGSSDGNYSIKTSNGEWPRYYYIAAWDDKNYNGSIDTGDGFGFWDSNKNGEWDEDILVLNPGDNISKVDIQMTIEKSAFLRIPIVSVLPSSSDISQDVLYK